MASFNVDFKLSVHKDFRRLSKSVAERVMKRIMPLPMARTQFSNVVG